MGNEWKGRKFLLVSLAVTTASIIFFFALRLIFPTIKEEAQELRREISPFAQRVIDWGGIRVQSIELNILAEEGERDFFAREKSLEAIRKTLDVYYGQSFWWVDLESIKKMVMESGWARSVHIRRSFPSTLEIHLEPRKARFLLKARRGWALADADGVLITQTDQIPGWMASLPIVVGFQNILTGQSSAVELNRNFSRERGALAELSRILDSFESRLSVNVETVSVSFDRWVDEPLFILGWTERIEDQSRDFEVTILGGHWEDRLQNLQYVLSDAKESPMPKVRVLGQFEDRWILAAEEK